MSTIEVLMMSPKLICSGKNVDMLIPWYYLANVKSRVI